MALHIPYHQHTFRPQHAAGQGDRPVEFDLAPAEGPDQARLKSILFGTAGLVGGGEGQRQDWSPATQDAVIAALEKAYNERPVSLVRLIYALKEQKIRSFADAFKLRKG